MSSVTQGIIAGLVFAAVTVASMLPMKFDDKRTALLGAFIGRFSIGFLIPITNLGTTAWVKGLLIGGLLSLSDAVITKNYAPILITGIIGGVIVALITG